MDHSELFLLSDVISGIVLATTAVIGLKNASFQQLPYVTGYILHTYLTSESC